MPRRARDWEAEWKEKAAEARKLAKRANQRMVRLERYAQRGEYKNILNYAYKKAQKYISAVFGESKSGKADLKSIRSSMISMEYRELNYIRRIYLYLMLV